MAFTWGSALRITLLLLLLTAVIFACFTLPVEKILKDFLLWVDKDLGPWGPLVLAVAYIPLTVLAVPASVLTLGGGYLFGLPVGFVADSIGATVGAGAAFLLGRTIGRSFVVSKLKDYPQFRSVAIAIRRSGFKIVLLLRLVPLLPFNVLNYLLSVTPVPIGEYMLASWLGMMPITLALVYVGTTLKDLSDVTHGWSEFSTARWVSHAFLISGLAVSVVLMVCVTKVAKSALEKALAENEDVDNIVGSPQLPIVGEPHVDLHQPLIIKIDSAEDTHEK
ncbi:SNARE associated Golgi protein - like 5 [Theobroma cacao]|nr:SNARE associated Golgi protein - like 5 [Theobroma cacao]